MAQYFYTETNTIYPSYQSIRHLYPNTSIPKDKDIPSLSLYVIHATDPGEAPEGSYWKQELPELREDGQYYAVWSLHEFEVPQE